MEKGNMDGAKIYAQNAIRQKNQALNYLRVKAFPFNGKVEKFITQHEQVFVIEQNRDGQLHHMLITETNADPKKLKSLRFYNGIPIFAKDIIQQIEEEINSGKAA